MKPIDLYRMVMGSQIWTITSADAAQSHNDELYVPTSVGRGGIESKNEMAKANLEIRLNIEHELSQLLLSSYNEQVLSLTVFTVRDSTVDVTWKGRLASQKPGDTYITLTFESVFTSLRRPGVRARFQKSCRHALYGRGCKLNPEDFAVPASLLSAAGSVLTIPEAAGYTDGTFIGGMLRTPDSLLSYVIGHVGNQITVQRVSASILNAINGAGYGNSYGNSYGGISVTLYPGCDHSRTTCKNNFNNLDRYGGFDWIPQKNPMGGSSII